MRSGAGASAIAGIAIGVALIALFFGYRASQRADRSEAKLARTERELRATVQALADDLAPLERQLNRASKALKKRQVGLAPLAARTLQSVYTIETSAGHLGSGFLAWNENGDSYFLTAAHVVADGPVLIRVSRRGGSWGGAIVSIDQRNDLALLRVSGSPLGIGRPLWPDAEVRRRPKPGDQVLLIGSPYGLEGTVTTGIVSRVTTRSIQTDAAANPGNSGGPAVDTSGHVVGVLVAGGGENLNFAVPIDRACIVIRDCKS